MVQDIFLFNNFLVYFIHLIILALCLSFLLSVFLSCSLSFFLALCLSFLRSVFLSCSLSFFLTICLSFLRSVFLSYFVTFSLFFFLSFADFSFITSSSVWQLVPSLLVQMLTRGPLGDRKSTRLNSSHRR